MSGISFGKLLLLLNLASRKLLKIEESVCLTVKRDEILLLLFLIKSIVSVYENEKKLNPRRRRCGVYLL